MSQSLLDRRLSYDRRLPYEPPDIVDERVFEVTTRACNKVPGIGDPQYCGPVWLNKYGPHAPCYLNPDAKSS